jgi:hypothetical protein
MPDDFGLVIKLNYDCIGLFIIVIFDALIKCRDWNKVKAGVYFSDIAFSKTGKNYSSL